jgi:hypothetical protein
MTDPNGRSFNDLITAQVNARTAQITAVLKRLAVTSNAMRQAGASEVDIAKWAGGELQTAGLLTAEQAARALEHVRQEHGGNSES